MSISFVQTYPVKRGAFEIAGEASSKIKSMLKKLGIDKGEIEKGGCAHIDEKIKALRLLMKTYVKDKEFVFPEHAIEAVTIFKLEVTDFTGKRRKT